jgi:F-type H+-transporting ATPase subunit a
MDELINVPQFTINLLGLDLTFNYMYIFMTWAVMAVLIIFSLIATRKAGLVPHSVQVVAELLVNYFYELTVDALGEERAKNYFPLICSLFMFVLLCNWIGIIPNMAEPTRDLNTTLGLGLLGGVIAHYSGIKAKGFGGYLKEYCSPMWFMFPLNLIGELAKVVSISFRLYGNIMGGAIIIIVVTQLPFIKAIFFPPGLVLFFGMFVGGIQAFVFTMLTMVYISLMVK